ncbi:hypothetical protein J4219_08155 [Candidatus Woesearchaeota archaeon]|nr:hypothetical protein [Candidatus Woesearchaeota archaeon]
MLSKLSHTLCALVLSGCGALTYHTPQDPMYRGPTPLDRSIEERFRYKDDDGIAPITTLVRSENRLLYTLETSTFSHYDEASQKDRQVTFEHYRTRLRENAPLVLVAPILGGKYAIERPLCETLAENGISAVLVHRPKHMLRFAEFDNLETFLRSIVSDRRCVLDALDCEYDQMGSIGISMGAITNVPLIAVEHRLQYNILGMPGANIPLILMTSTEGSLEEFVEEHSRELSKNADELLEHFKEGYESDPANLAPYIDARNTRMFLAFFDTVVPYERGLELHEALGRPELDVLPTGHYTAALYYFWIKDMAVEFFQERFGVDSDAVESRKNSILRRHVRRRVS